MNSIIKLGIIGVIGVFIIVGIGTVAYQAYGQSDIVQQINDTHFRYKNGTIFSLTPE